MQLSVALKSVMAIVQAVGAQGAQSTVIEASGEFRATIIGAPQLHNGHCQIRKTATVFP